MRHQIVAFLAILFCSVAWGQTQSAPPSSNSPSGQQSMPGMDMSGGAHHDMAGMPMGGDKAESEAGAHAMHSMEGHMDMGPHMKMTALRPMKPGDAMRAQQIAGEARKAAEKYKDYHVALDDGFKIFLPNVPQKVYHFTSRSNAMEGELRFNPDHPTSLLYEKHGDDYTLIGVMYTAPKSFTEDQLDERIPLSIAQWHEHVNFCIPPLDDGMNCVPTIPSSVFADRSRLKQRATRQAAVSVQWFLTGWSTSIPSKKISPTSGRLSANTATRTEVKKDVHEVLCGAGTTARDL